MARQAGSSRIPTRGQRSRTSIVKHQQWIFSGLRQTTHGIVDAPKCSGRLAKTLVGKLEFRQQLGNILARRLPARFNSALMRCSDDLLVE